MRKKWLGMSYLVAFSIGIASVGKTAFAYNGTKAAQYAIGWAYSYNTKEYYKADFDCTNFVSQCLVAGGKKCTAGSSNYNSLSHWRPHLATWENANRFKKYWKQKIDVTTYKIPDSESEREKLVLKIYKNFWSGDIIQYSYSDDVSKHSQIVVGQTSFNDHASLRLAQHTEGDDQINLLEYLNRTGYKKIKTFKFTAYK